MAKQETSWQQRLIGTHTFEEHEQVLRYKMMMSAILIMVFAVTITSMAIVRYLNGQMLQASADATVVCLLLLGWMILRANKRFFKPVSRLLLLSGLSLAALQLVGFPESQSRLIWFSSVVYIGFFLLDRREGWLWIATIALGLGGFYMYDATMIGLNAFELVTFLFNLFIIALLLGWYETFKEQSSKMHRQHRLELEETIAEKTRELQRLNAVLHQRVDSEIEKNREKEKQMIHQSRLAQMGEMISMIAHQWRQPLTSIAATASGMKLKVMKGDDDSTYFLDAINNINRYAKHLSSTIDDFRDFFKPNKEKSRFSLKASVERSLEIIEPSLGTRGIRVNVSCKDDPKIYGYPNEIRQVILNLIKNAEDVLLEKKIAQPQIAIALESIGNSAVLSVSDNAGGFDAAIKERLFDPYFTTKEKRDGTGLGLYMSKVIVEEHCGGRISAYNAKAGAVFEITLRIADAGGD